MKAVFRIDANTVVGGGHFVRCLALADKLRQRGCQCMFMVKSLGIFFSEQLKQQEYPIVYVSDNSVESSIQALLAYDPLQQLYDWLVVDSYDLDCCFTLPNKRNTHLLIASFFNYILS